ncbi:hypothetical protein MLD38_018272 [Melastoma candidum]|uniref:Uncharacterized protein n=1 Tax=Melastoma candidum TaxID=119954 RepID=A0ACB9QTU1_9MYRT|nr:hypothetical protein MLD38_018272 [Melastoma candidum]
MRIRKNRNITSFLLGLQTSSSPAAAADDNQHLIVPSLVCQLNQSPWDVIPFSSSSSSSSNPYHHRHHSQFGADNNGFKPLAGCSSFGSVRPVDSDAKPKVGFGDEGRRTVREFSGPALRIKCAKTDGKSWECKREAKEGHNFCEHHISQLKSYSSGKGGAVPKPATLKRAGPVRVRAARKKKSDDSSSSCSSPSSSSASRSSQYYYYSGFGPSWRKKRGERPERESRASRGGNARTSDLHMEDEAENEDEYKGEGDRKRVRKPIKARSLKSLM